MKGVLTHSRREGVVLVALSVTDVPGIITAVHVAAKANQDDQLGVELARLERALDGATARSRTAAVRKLDRMIDRNGIGVIAKGQIRTCMDKLKPPASPGQGKRGTTTKRRSRARTQ